MSAALELVHVPPGRERPTAQAASATAGCASSTAADAGARRRSAVLTIPSPQITTAAPPSSSGLGVSSSSIHAEPMPKIGTSRLNGATLDAAWRLMSHAHDPYPKWLAATTTNSRAP